LGEFKPFLHGQASHNGFIVYRETTSVA